MIKFENICKDEPFVLLKSKYDEAVKANQKLVEAISISSFSKENNEVDSRYVNLKFVKNNEFIFFSNYESPKSFQFLDHNQISAILFWSEINTQIRMKASIEKTSEDFSNNYFKNRDKNKNALAISSNQSKKTESYSEVERNYQKTLENENLSIRPEYWGGFAFVPYYFEFWEGHDKRLNKRVTFSFEDGKWLKCLLQP